MKQLRKICILAMTMILLSSALVACGDKSSGDAEKIVIGYIGPLTGEGAL